MSDGISTWREIANYAAACPSPHNTQPFRLRVKSSLEAEVVFVPRRGLPVADPEGRFTWLAAGIFVEICSIAVHSIGFELEREVAFAPLYPLGDTQSPQTVARLRLEKTVGSIPDLPAHLILDRQTSRLPYDGRPLSEALIRALKDEASRHGHQFEMRSDPKAISWVVELNRQSLFHDMENDAIRNELTRWLRFDEREESITRDGLSARCMGIPARLLRTLFTRPQPFLLPGVRSLVGAFYKSTMKGVGTIGWLRGPYANPQDWFAAGKCMFRLWLIVTQHGYYWHPYGSVITSDQARINMLKYLGLPAETPDDFAWLLLRLGQSPKPPKSLRLPVEEILLCA